MNNAASCQGQHVAGLDLSGITLIVGLGKTGLSVARTVSSLGGRVIVVDSRHEPSALLDLRRDFPQLPVHLGGFPQELFAQASRIVVSPGVPCYTPAIAQARARGVPVWGDIELFARLARAPIAAITGSNGKSTVTTLLGEMAERAGIDAAVGGNLGTPALELLQRQGPDLFVLELSSFQLEATHSLRARVATVLNISPDHMDRYTDLQQYIEAKRRIFRGADSLVVNADDARVVAIAPGTERMVRFTLAAPREGEFGVRDHAGGRWLCYGDELWLETRELQIRGSHNLANALAALAMGHSLGFPREPMLAALRSFTGLPHRSQLVAEAAGVRWFNDSKGTNVGATIATLNGLPGRLILIAGGDGKGQDFSPLRAAMSAKVKAVVLIGRDAPLIAAALGEAVPVHYANDMHTAAACAAQLAEPGDSVLLSPACASFDMFASYEERGAVFSAIARRQALC